MSGVPGRAPLVAMRAGAHTFWHLRKRTARLTLLALVAACSLCATAQAAELPAPATDAAAQLGQAAATAPATVADTTAAAQSAVRQSAATTAGPAQPAVEQVAKTAGTVAGPAQPAVEATVRSIQRGPAPSASTGDDHQAAPPAATAPRRDGDGGPANRSGRNEPKSPSATGTKRGAAAAADAPRSGSHTAAHPSPASASTPSAAASHLAGAGSEDVPTSPNDGSTPNGVSTASPFSSGFGLGGVALLAAAFILAAPAIKRRLRVDGALFRPTLFVAVLERPG
jgi:hypothetical protein